MCWGVLSLLHAVVALPEDCDSLALHLRLASHEVNRVGFSCIPWHWQLTPLPEVKAVGDLILG